jgi:hypothetical protein
MPGVVHPSGVDLAAQEEAPRGTEMIRRRACEPKPKPKTLFSAEEEIQSRRVGAGRLNERPDLAELMDTASRNV